MSDEDAMTQNTGLPETGLVRLKRILAPGGPIPISKSTWLADPEPEGSLKRTAEAMDERSIAVADPLHPGAVARDKLRIDARKWLLSKMLPKIYGDRNFQTGEGGTKGEPLQVEWQEPVDR